MLSLYTELSKGIPVTNPCAWCCVNFCTGVPTPSGHSWADTGMLVDTNWVSTQQMNAYTRVADDKIREAKENFQGWSTGTGDGPGAMDMQEAGEFEAQE